MGDYCKDPKFLSDLDAIWADGEKYDDARPESKKNPFGFLKKKVDTLESFHPLDKPDRVNNYHEYYSNELKPLFVKLLGDDDFMLGMSSQQLIEFVGWYSKYRVSRHYRFCCPFEFLGRFEQLSRGERIA